MSFCQQAWTQITPLYDNILAMPFNQELAAGSLTRDRFIFYMLQDAHYLIYFGKALAVTGAKAPDPEAMIQFTQSAHECVVVERSLHESFFKDFKIDAIEAAAAKPSPTCSHYINYLLSTAYNEPYEVSVYALLPCFWIYWEVGKHLLTIAKSNNPYQAWIDTYADDAFAEGVKKVIGIADRVGNTASPLMQARMMAAFEKASVLEWMFWDSAYRQEAWPTF